MNHQTLGKETKKNDWEYTGENQWPVAAKADKNGFKSKFRGHHFSSPKIAITKIVAFNQATSNCAKEANHKNIIKPDKSTHEKEKPN